MMLIRRESTDNYHAEIFRQGWYWVILCKDGIQWILQRQKGGRGADWRTFGYRTTRAAPLRIWASLKRANASELIELPENLRGRLHG